MECDNVKTVSEETPLSPSMTTYLARFSTSLSVFVTLLVVSNDMETRLSHLIPSLTPGPRRWVASRLAPTNPCNIRWIPASLQGRQRSWIPNGPTHKHTLWEWRCVNHLTKVTQKEDVNFPNRQTIKQVEMLSVTEQKLRNVAKLSTINSVYQLQQGKDKSNISFLH